MRKSENIARFSAEKIRRKIARGESKTDWKRVEAMSQTEVERLADKDEGRLAPDWESTVILGLPPAKQDIHIRLDGDILYWFKARGRGYQTRINAVSARFRPDVSAGRTPAGAAKPGNPRQGDYLSEPLS